jgi:perosamine synthetase
MVVDDLNDHETITLGNNYRMSELHAAIAIEQLKRLDGFVQTRRERAAQVTRGLSALKGLEGVHVPEGYTHSYYLYPVQYEKEVWGISRATVANAMKAEGFPISPGYQKPIYLLPMYQHKKVYNHTQIPFSLIDKPTQSYKPGICPVVESMYHEKLFVADVCRIPFTSNDVDNFLEALNKVWIERDKLYEFERGIIHS